MSKKALKTISLLWISSLLGAGCAFLVQVLLARYLDPIDFGDFSAAFATVTLFVPLAGFGISQFWLKIFGEEGWNATRWLSSSISFAVSSSLVVFSLLIFWAFIGPHDKVMQIIILSLSIYIFGQVTVELVGSKLQLEERYIFLALWQILPHLIRLGLLVSFIFLLDKVLNVIVVAQIYAVVAIVFTIIGAFLLYKMLIGVFALKGHKINNADTLQIIPNIKMVIFQAWPFGLAGLFHLIYFQSDIILLKYLSGSEAAANYNIAFTIMVAIYIFPSVIYQKFLLPKIHRWAHHDREKFYYTYKQGNLMMFIIGSVGMVLVWFSSSFLISLLFGIKYTNSSELLNILAFSIPVIFVASSVGATLVTKEHMKKKVLYMGTIAVLNIVLNIILIPIYGASGAAVATVLSNIFLLIIYYIAAEKYVFIEKKRVEEKL